MTELLDRVRGELRARLNELVPLVEEARQLERAIAALDGSGGQATSTPRHEPAPTVKPRPASREALITYVTANPGSTAGDVALATGLSRTSVATRLTQLAKAGDIAKAKRGYNAAK
jgi:hypothetical protein